MNPKKSLFLIILFTILVNFNLIAWTSSNEGVCYTMDTLCSLSDSITFNEGLQRYEIGCNIIILENDTLKINPGQYLFFLMVIQPPYIWEYYGIKIFGTLCAIGESNNPIYMGDKEYNFSNGNIWCGIQFYNTSPNGESKLKYCDIKGAVFVDESLWPCQEPAVLCKNSSPLIDHCRISKMDSNCETDGGIGILCIGSSNTLISYTSFEELHNSIAILCFPDYVDNILTFPSPLIFGCNIMPSVEGYFSPPTYYDVVIYQGGFIDNCYLGATINAADSTLGYPIDTIGDGICTTSSTFELRPRFMNVDGIVNPRGDTLLTGINEKEIDQLPTTTKLLILNNNYPNPFSGHTTIEFEVKSNTAAVSLEIFDSKGNKIRELVQNKNYISGNYNVDWHGENDSGEKVKEGIYFYKLTSGGQMMVKKAIVVK
jgi:hypothetical protein